MVGEDAIAGAAMVEFTLFAPLLVVMSIYSMDFGIYFFHNIEVQNAAQAGAQWAIANHKSNSLIPNAGQNATNFTTVTVSSNQVCGCSVDSSGNPVVTPITPSACTPNSTCNTTGLVGTYVKVKATKTAWQSYVPYGLVPSTYNLTATSWVRVQ
jgi:Flp pilus assembly protein TadG